MNAEFELYPVSSLEKIRATQRPVLFEEEKRIFENERLAFQVAAASIGRDLRDCRVEVEGEGEIGLFSVESVPCTIASRADGDDYLSDSAGSLVPDVLRPCDGTRVQFPANLRKGFFVTVKGLSRGEHRIAVSVRQGETLLGRAEYRVTVLSALLPETDFKHTNWMHYDCIANAHGLKMFSEEYFAVLKRYVLLAVEHGINVLYVPLFTPPLDTDFCTERKTAQLVGVRVVKDGYEFDFSLLEKFFVLGEECGIKYYEFSHLFSQWGAQACPKILAEREGETVRIFGGDSDSLSREYQAFLTAFLKKLRKFVTEHGLEKRSFLHISDEPAVKDVERYRACRDTVKRAYPDCVIIDATSEPEVFAQRLADIPVIGTDGADSYSANQSGEWWAYYCTGQYKNALSNRFLSMPLERTRVIGIQLYLSGAGGFLQWGYNFYNTFLSRDAIDPFTVTDAGGGFQSGDAFIVYPDLRGGGAFSSLRLEAMADAAYDYRALKWLEKEKGRAFTEEFLRKNGLGSGFCAYVKSPVWMAGIREKINGFAEQEKR